MKLVKAITASIVALGISSAWAETVGIRISSNYKNEGRTDYIENGNKHFTVCYVKSSDNYETSEQQVCGEDLKDYGISYTFTKDVNGEDPTQIIVSNEDFAANPIQFDGGINVSKSWDPIVNTDHLKQTIPSGTYYLVVKIENVQKAISVAVTEPVPPQNALQGDEGTLRLDKTANTKATFNATRTSASEITITTDKTTDSKYTITDMKGQVVSAGLLKNNETRVKVPTTGSYVVKVGRNYKKVNVR
jgi:hypothetical protein